MNLGIESETLEFKKSTGEIEKAVDNIASMLNKHGHGTLFFGVAPDGNVTGQQISASSLDDVARKIKEAIRPIIYPEIRQELLDGKTVIRVDFSGSEKPYSCYGRYYSAAVVCMVATAAAIQEGFTISDGAGIRKRDHCS